MLRHWAVVTIIVVGVIFALLKSWQPSAPPINLSKAQLQKQTKENNIVSIQPHRSVPGFPTGTPESIVKAALGEQPRLLKVICQISMSRSMIWYPTKLP